MNTKAVVSVAYSYKLRAPLSPAERPLRTAALGRLPPELHGGDLGEGAGAAAAGLSLEGGAARLLPPGAGGSSRCSCRGAGALQSAAKISGETWVALDSERGAGPLRTTSAKLPFDKKENRFLASGTPVYEKRGPKWCIASPGGPRRVQPCPGLSSTTRMPFSPDTGKPRTVRRGRANPHGSGSVETPLSKHLLSQVLQWLLHLVRPWPPLGHLSLLSKMVRFILDLASKCERQHLHTLWKRLPLLAALSEWSANHCGSLRSSSTRVCQGKPAGVSSRRVWWENSPYHTRWVFLINLEGHSTCCNCCA
ncbi:hypothetical protein ISCGN_012125 [Ixodes scapularis]